MDTAVLVVGSPNTDIITSWTHETVIGPGGKARNIADMTARLLHKGQVALVGRTSEDSLGLWKVPMAALYHSGVNTDFMTIDKTSKSFPGIALIAIDREGESNTTFLPGASAKFNRYDVDAADSLFQSVASNNGYIVFTLECPSETLDYAMQKARALGLNIMIDCGGLAHNAVPCVMAQLLSEGAFFIKPNVQEVQCITGITVKDFSSAGRAAAILKSMGAQNVLITAGKHGAYLFTETQKCHIPVPNIVTDRTDFDSTGCGDQALAVICASLATGVSLEVAAHTAILAATLQFYRRGVQPLSWEEIVNSKFSEQSLALSFA